MNQQSIFEAMGMVKDEYILESEAPVKRRVSPGKVALLAGAAALLCATAIAAPYFYGAVTGGDARCVKEGWVLIEPGCATIAGSIYEIQLKLDLDSQVPSALETCFLPQVPEGWNTDSGLLTSGLDKCGSQRLAFAWSNGDGQGYMAYQQSTLDSFQARSQSAPEEAYTVGTQWVPPDGTVTARMTAMGNVNALELHVAAEKSVYSMDREPGAVVVDPQDYYLYYWSDGAYLYTMEFPAGIPEEQKVELINSVRAVEDITPYLVEPARKPGAVPVTEPGDAGVYLLPEISPAP